MPYSITRRGSQYCVVKDSDGKTMGCHASRTKARRQQKALYAAEASADEGSNMTVMDTTADTSKDTPVTAEREPWEGVLATVLSPTQDGRIIEEGIAFRDLPVPFSVQIESLEGHEGSVVCGRIEDISFIPLSKFTKDGFDMDGVREGAIVVYGYGSLDGSEAAAEAKRYLDNGAGVSLDGLHFTGNLFNSEDLSQVDTSELQLDDVFAGIMNMTYLRGMSGKIAGVTVVSIPAFEEATVMVASAFTPSLRFSPKTLTASAAGLAPLKPPKEWFFREEAPEPTPLTVTEDGEVYGHLALWNQCHAAFASCERPPSSLSGYSFFHVGTLQTEEGEYVNVGRITVGEAGRAKGGHASLIHGRQGAMEHYDKTGCVAAFVRATDGRHGIWLSGAVRSDAPAERIRDLRANPPSGDWRDYELVAVLSVPVPGFPIPRFGEARLVAAATAEGLEEETPPVVAALIATAHTEPVLGDEILDGENVVGHTVEGWTFPCAPLNVLEYRRRMKKAKKRRRELTDEYEDGLASITAEQRRKWAKSGVAMGDGSFPITKCSGEGTSAVNARRAIGRAPESKRGAVRAHIAKRERALGCSNDED